jgi:hypothetical protein
VRAACFALATVLPMVGTARAVAEAAPTQFGYTHASPAPSLPATVTLTRSSDPLPPSFFGLSVEVNEMMSYERAGGVFDRVLSLLRPGAGDPILLRVGGMSADHADWEAPTA